MDDTWKTRILIGSFTVATSIAGFFSGRWINYMDGKAQVVDQQEARIAVLERIAQQQLDTQRDFAEALKEFRRVVDSRH